MIWLWTILCIVGLYVLASIVLPMLTLIVISFPLIQIGRWIKPLQLLMWFISRYLGFLAEGLVLLFLTAFASGVWDVYAPALYVVDVILLLQLFNTLYQFDVMCYSSQSGPWAIAREGSL